jgi:hypothetical protein
MYKVENIELRLKELTLNEAEQVELILSKIQDKATGNINANSQQLKDLFKLVLERVDGGDMKEVHFGNMLEKESVAVIQDFFSQRIRNLFDMQNSFKNLIKDIQKQPEN